MSWLKKLAKWDAPQPPPSTQNVDNPAIICFEAFKSHWLQICEVISATSPRPAFVTTKETVVTRIENITIDDVDTVRNLLEQMIYLLVEEQSSGQLLGPLLEFAITQDIFEKLLDWWNLSLSFKSEMMLILLKVYEVLISQAQYSLLHHKQLVGPMLKLLSSDKQSRSEELDGHVVLLLNLLCVWMNRDSTLVEVFFNASANHGPANFLIFSLLIEFVHREGTVGQQARDALLLCMALSAENETVANYVVQHSNFCPVLATGLSGLYSSLPRHMVVRADDWHCLNRSDWSHVPALTNFMNSFEFCNSVVEVAHTIVGDQLIEYFYNGFLVSVFGPSLHKTSADEVVVTAAYLNLFLCSVTAPLLMRCFLRFMLTHHHENGLIINTLIQRIASNNRLALVSLSLIRTLVDLNCEDLLLQLVFRYLIPCQHLLASQRRAICDVDLHNASAARFLALTPAACRTESDISKALLEDGMFRPVQAEQLTNNQGKEATENRERTGETSPPLSPGNNTAFHALVPPSEQHESSSFHQISAQPAVAVNQAFSDFTVNEDLSVTINMHTAVTSDTPDDVGRRVRTITSPSTMAEFGPDLKSQLELNTSYMDYLEDARSTIDQCKEACQRWSAPYDGQNPSADPQGVTQGPPAAESLPQDSPTVPRKVEDSIVLPVEHTTSNVSDAMKALSATYETLNLTARALNGDAPMTIASTTLDTMTSSPTAVANKASDDEEVPTNGETLVSNVPGSIPQLVETEEANTRTDASNNEGRDPKAPDVSDSVQDTDIFTLNEADDDNADTSSSSPSHRPNSDVSKPHSSSIDQSSSVDDFFRSLMEIVPKSTRETMENPKANQAATTSPQGDEDIESGIELSSEGDVHNTSPERNLNEVEDGEDGSQQNEDTMSQVSVNTDDMTDEPVKKNGDSTSRNGEDETSLDLDRSQRYSYADETDDELDDTASIASSSFYEPCDDYTPTELSVAPSAPLKLQGAPYTGPLMSTLFAKLDQMINNSLYENLLLTGIVTRLACYPQPLLRSFLLNTQMVFHPSVRSLYQVLNSARSKIDTYAAQVADFTVLVHRAQRYLLARGMIPLSGDARMRSTVQDRPMPVPKVKTRTLGDMFMRRKPKDKKKTLLPKLETLLERRGRTTSRTSERDDEKTRDGAGESTSSSQFYVKQTIRQREREERKMRELRTKNAVYASIVLAEFLKELAAVAQEHAVTHDD